MWDTVYVLNSASNPQLLYLLNHNCYFNENLQNMIVAWMLLCKRGKVHEKNYYTSGDIEFFLGDYYITPSGKPNNISSSRIFKKMLLMKLWRLIVAVLLTLIILYDNVFMYACAHVHACLVVSYDTSNFSSFFVLLFAFSLYFVAYSPLMSLAWNA